MIRTATPVSILHVIPIDGVGGVEVAVRSMLGIDISGVRFKILLIAGTTLAADRTQVIEAPYASPDQPLAQLRAVRNALACKPDVLICSLWRSVPLALLVKVLRPVTKLVFFLHNERPVHFIDQIFSQLAILSADEIWCDSTATYRARVPARKFPRSRVISFVTARQPPARSVVTQIVPRFVVWARLRHQKGIDRAIAFIAAVVDRGIDANFDIWGPDAGEQAALARQVENLELGNRVAFRGAAKHDSLAEIAAKACFFLQLSRFEGMAMGAVEAMQLGLVPIVTPVGETANYVVDDVSGIVVDPNDFDMAISKIEILLSKPSEYHRLRAGAIATWQNASIYSEDIYRAALSVAKAEEK